MLLGLVSIGGTALLALLLVLLFRQGETPSSSSRLVAAPSPDSSAAEERVVAPAAAAAPDSAPARAAESPAPRTQRQAAPLPEVRRAPDTTITMQLRSAALEARSASRSAGATPGQLAAGDSLLRGGDSLRGIRKYNEAGMAYSAARAVWAGIVIKQAPPTSPPPAEQPVQRPEPPAVVAQRQDPQPAIQRRVREYASAIESESTDRIRQVYPGLTSQQERNWRQFFDAVNDVKATLAVSSLTVRGDSADVTLTGQYAYQNSTTGRAERQPASVSMRLARTAEDEWVVVGIK